MAELFYPELSYKIVGILFEVYNELGYGLRESNYQQALKILFKKNNIEYKEQLKSEIKFKGKIIGCYFLDFLIDDKIVLELKVKERFHKEDLAQVYDYLKANDKKLGIIVAFAQRQVRFKRIIFYK